jgi:hypothetical protein
MVIGQILFPELLDLDQAPEFSWLESTSHESPPVQLFSHTPKYTAGRKKFQFCSVQDGFDEFAPMRCRQAAFGTLGGTGGLGWAASVGARFPTYGFELSFQRLDLLLEREDAPQVGHREIRKRFHLEKDASGFARVKHWFY